MTLAAEAILIVGIPPARKPNSRNAVRNEWIQWANVDTIEPIVEQAAPSKPNDRRENHSMKCEEARTYLWREPFQPVRIRLKDGRTFDIRHQGMTLAAEAILIVGIPPTDEPYSRYADRSEWVQWANVDAIEPLVEQAAPAV